jgi:hypothetical protein
MSFFSVFVKAVMALLRIKRTTDTVVETTVKVARAVETVNSMAQLAKDTEDQAKQAVEQKVNQTVDKVLTEAMDTAEKKLSSGMSEYIPHKNEDLNALLKAATKKS